MPKKQPTAAKRARAAVRSSGAKYTAALREAGGPDLPPHLELFEDQVLSEGEQMVMDGLRALAAEGEPLPKAPNRVGPGGRRCRPPSTATCCARCSTGRAARGYTKANRGPRVPVPVRAADGTVTVVAMPEWARLHEGRWIWSHTGWPVEAPGRIVDPPQEFAPAPELRWQVTVWLDLGRKKGEVLGEDYGGSSGGWQTVGWCTSRDDARQIARAYTVYRGHYARADVLEHGGDLGIASRTTDTFLPAPDAPERPRTTTVSGPRPASLHRSEVPEPAWHGAVTHPPNVSLHVWTGTEWKTLVWTGSQAGMIAQNLGIGQDGPYLWAESWGPRHPDRDLHDWTQEGRELWRRYPDPDFQERTELIDSARRAKEDALAAALADRGGLTPEQAAARLAQGGEEYRHLLAVGQAVISRALHTARRALPEGPERTAVRHALDDLTTRHRPPADAERIANEQLDSEIEADRAPDVTAWCRRAVAEYIAPAAEPGLGDQQSSGWR